VNSLLKTVTRQRRDCDLNPGPTAPESSTLTTLLPSHPDTSTRVVFRLGTKMHDFSRKLLLSMHHHRRPLVFSVYNFRDISYSDVHSVHSTITTLYKYVYNKVIIILIIIQHTLSPVTCKRGGWRRLVSADVEQSSKTWMTEHLAVTT